MKTKGDTMTTLDAIKKLQDIFPNKYISIEERLDVTQFGDLTILYSGIIIGVNGWSTEFGTLDDMINTFTLSKSLDKTFDTHFIVGKCESQFCDALNKSF